MLRFFFSLVVLSSCGLLGAAQQGGLVRSAGQPIPGATVTAAQGDRKLSTVTDESGRYLFPDLSPGAWRIEVEIFGFVTERREVTVGTDAAGLEWTLELKGREQKRTEIAGAAPRRGAAVASNAGPNLGRGQNGGARAPNGNAGFQSVDVNATEGQLAAAISGTTNGVDGAATADASGANESFLVNGSLSRGLQSVDQQDAFEARRVEFMQRMGEARGFGGAPGMDGEGGGAPGIPGAPGGPGGPGGGAPGGFAGGRGGPGGGRGFGGPGGGGPGGMGGRPDFRGRGGPGGRPGERVRSFGNRRRGAEPLRGAAYFTLRNSALDARPYSISGQTVDKASYAQNRFGFTAGGQLNIPHVVHPERTFFFFNYNGARSRNPQNQLATLPTLLERTGDFSQSLARGPVQIFDPDTRLPFANNRIPVSRMDSAALGLLNFFPLPNQPGLVQNYQFITSVPQNTDNLGVRLNQTVSRKNRLDFNFNLQRRTGNNAQLFGFRDEVDGAGFSSSAGWSHNFTPRIILNARWNFSRNRSQTVPFFAFRDNVAAQLGINGTSREPINWGPPNLSFTNYGGLSDASPVLRRDQTSGGSAGLTLIRNKHTLTFGGEIRRMQLNSKTDQNARGTFSFSGLRTSAFDAGGSPLAGTGYDLADFLLGLPQSSSIRFGSANTYFRSTVYSGYSQDDWRLRPNLSINGGLRYEYFTPYTEKYDRMANLDIAPGFTGVAVVTPGAAGPYSGAFSEALVDPDKNNFSPRIGIAWRPLAKKQLQVRGGYGIYFNGSVYNQFPSRLASQPPFASTASLTTSLLRPLTLTNGFPLSPSTTVTNTYAVDRAYKVGYAQTWNLSVQQTLPHALILELGYLGTKGTRLDIQRLPNRAAPGSPLTAEQRRQIGNAVGFTLDTSEGNSIYHSGHVRFMRRFQKGISANLTYTFAKSIDNASTFGGGGATVAQDDKNLRAERGLSSFDQRHALTAMYMLASPVAENGLLRGNRWAMRLLSEWTLNGSMTAGTGTPMTPRVLGNLSNSGGSIGSGRADATGADVSSGTGFFNLLAFTIPPSGRYGNAGRNTIPGLARLSFNTSFGRSFRISERRRLEFRAESTNTFNSVNFTSLGTVVNATNYGLPLAAQPMRSIVTTLRLRF